MNDIDIHRFLILCLRAHLDSSQWPAVHAFVAEEEIDWSAVVSAATDEVISPLLYVTLSDQALLPADTESELQLAFRYSALRNTGLFYALERVLAQLDEAGIPTIVLKGGALAEEIYGSIALRQMLDLDLLLHHQDMQAALELLASAGYVTSEIEPTAGLALAFENEIQLHKPGRVPVSLELHWSLFDSPYYQHRLSMQWFWESAKHSADRSVPIYVLGQEAQILHLCGHLALHHQGLGLRWQYDIVAAIYHWRDTLDWNELLKQAQAMDLLIPLQTLLPRLVSEWGAPVPLSILDCLKVLEPSAEETRVFAQLNSESRPVVRRFLTDLQNISGWRNRVVYAGASLFPSSAYMRDRYAIPHPILVPVYYPYRWFFGLREALIARTRLSQDL